MLPFKRVFLAAIASAMGFLAVTGLASAARGLQTALVPNEGLTKANYELEYPRIKAAGATAVRPSVNWAKIAADRPANATNPADPAYDWATVDEEVVLARANGLEPVLLVYNAPKWAQPNIPPGVPHTNRDGPYKPSPKEFGKFAQAVARRYSGSFQGLPRVRYYIAWNEPNIYRYLTPQTLDGKPVSPKWYRKLLTAFSTAVHGVHSNNRVVAGALAQFGIGRRISPMFFMRELLCLTNDKRPRSTCSAKVSFDVWSHHPYTRGDAFHKAQGVDDVSLGDLPRMHDFLNAAVRAGKVRSTTKVQFWVDEFSWDSRPPDPSKLTVPLMLHARWVAESLYQMWLSGVSMATWFLLRDEPTNTSPLQSGLWFNGSQDNDLSQDWPKPALKAFRFPFVAYRNNKTITLWGRTPNSRSASLAIEAGTSSGWQRVGTVRAGGNGVFVGKLAASRVSNGKGILRARVGSDTSFPFSLKRPPDRFVLAFG
jgi:hypothetical protein